MFYLFKRISSLLPSPIPVPVLRIIDCSLTLGLVLFDLHIATTAATTIRLLLLGFAKATKKLLIPSNTWQIVGIPPVPILSSDSIPNSIVHLNLTLQKVAIKTELSQLKFHHIAGCVYVCV
jgi:hypothetical protein